MGRSTSRWVLTALILVIPSTGATADLLLDDFEAGSFHYLQTGNTSTGA